MKQFFVGLDLSLTSTGLVILDENGVVQEAASISFPKLKGAERLNAIQNEIRSMLSGYSNQVHHIKMIVIEGYAMHGIGKTFHIGELGGVVRLLLWRMKHPYIEVPPTQLKSFVTGKGAGDGASKDMMILNLFKQFNFEAGNNDIADAYGLARIAMAVSGHIEGLKKQQLEVIEKVINPVVKKKKAKKDES
jgi:Holliday junction resolvasome RuvABC endonuclease subunit